MNKSKFLKRSLAAILAILMVVAMVPSALAAHVVAESVPTARAAVDPGYNISVNGNKTEWDAAAEAYTAKVEFTEGADVADFNVSMIEVSKTSVTVAGKDDIDLGSLGSGLTVLEPKNAVQSVDSFGAGTYTYTLTAVTTDDNGDDTTYSFKLIVTATMKVNSTDASIKAIKTAKLKGIISAELDNDKNTIKLVKGLGVPNKIVASSAADYSTEISGSDNFKAVFVPSSDAAGTMSYTAEASPAPAKLTLKAQNGDTKEYTISFTEETVFDSFKLGDYEGKALSTDPNAILIDLPYSYQATASTITTTELEKMPISWTTNDANKVTIGTGTDAVESGEETLEFEAKTPGTTITDNGKYIVYGPKSAFTVNVQTKKSDGAQAVDIYLRVPVKNPEAKLTAIQIGPDDHNQIVNIPEGQTTVNVTMPYAAGVSSKDDLTATKIKVWGSTAAKVELARDWTSTNCFTTDGAGAPIGTPNTGVAESAKDINIKKTVYINVKSEDEKTTTLYTINVNPGEAGNSNRVLKSLEFIDPDDDDKVVATGSISGDKVTITVPFATGIDPWDTLAGLEVRAVASESAKIQVSNNVITADDGSATAAVYETKFTETVPATMPITTDDDKDTISAYPTTAEWTVNVAGLSVKISVTGTSEPDLDSSNNHTANSDSKYPWTFTPASTDLADYISDIQTALNALDSTNWGFAIGGTADSEGKYTVTMTATDAHKGAIDADTEATAIKPALSWEEKEEGLDGGRTPTSAVNMNTLVDYDEIVTLTDILDADTDESGPKCITIPTAGVTGDPAKGNQFKIKVYYGTGDADNEKTEYTVTINKKIPSNAGTISSVKVTENANATYDDDTVMYNGTFVGRNIKFANLPYALKVAHAAAGADKMRFSELKVSEGAKVVIKVDTAYTVMAVDEDEKDCSAPFKVGTGSTSWTETDEDIEVAVFSEARWQQLIDNGTITVTPGGSGSPDTVTGFSDFTDAAQKPTNLYKMSASYIAAENGSKLTSIASTLDENVKVEKGYNSYTITVPNSYVSTDTTSATSGKAFTLNFVPDSTSKLAAITANQADNTKIADVTSDEGDSKKQTAAPATPFVVVKNGDNYELKVATSLTSTIPFNANVISKFIVTSESKTNTSPYDIVVKVAAAETSNTIESITVDGTKAVLGDDGETWTLTLPYGTTDMVKLIDIKTVSKLATVKVDNVIYDKDLYYDLGADLAIEVAAESGPKATYTLKTEVSTEEPPVEDPSDNYTDIPAGGMGDWVKKAINYGIMGDTGATEDGKLQFSPSETTQRRWFALMVARADIMADDETITDKEAADKKLLADYGDKEPDFTDTANEADTAKAAIAYCQEKGIMNGDAGKFNPAGIVNRMEAASMLKNWLKLPEGGKENTHNFKDWDKIPDWAKGNINAVADDKIMNGHDDGTFGTENLTRVQTAVIMVQAYERLKESK